MIKNFVLFVRYPYTAGIIAMMWLGAAAFAAIDRSLNVVVLVGVTMFISIIIALMGFGGDKE